MRCSEIAIAESYFENKDGVMIPEMDAFALIPRTQWQYVMGPSLYRIMNSLFLIL